VYELKLDIQEAIVRLREKGWSRRAIARELGIDRETVGRYLRLAAKPATEVPAGSELQNGATEAFANGETRAPAEAKPAKVPAGPRLGAGAFLQGGRRRFWPNWTRACPPSGSIKTWSRRINSRPVTTR
jgi:hypothetical protein